MEEYLAMIKLFAGNFAPKGWAFCNGQLLGVAQNQALFSLLGTTYGGDGRTTFGLPDLRSRVPAGVGEYGGVLIQRGDKYGESSHTLVLNEIPLHNHFEMVSDADATQGVATTNASMAAPVTAAAPPVKTLGYNTQSPGVPLISSTISPTGGGQSHNNMQPYLGLSYIICTTGMYPPRQ